MRRFQSVQVIGSVYYNLDPSTLLIISCSAQWISYLIDQNHSPALGILQRCSSRSCPRPRPRPHRPRSLYEKSLVPQTHREPKPSTTPLPKAHLYLLYPLRARPRSLARKSIVPHPLAFPPQPTPSCHSRKPSQSKHLYPLLLFTSSALQNPSSSLPQRRRRSVSPHRPQRALAASMPISLRLVRNLQLATVALTTTAPRLSFTPMFAPCPSEGAQARPTSRMTAVRHILLSSLV